MNHVITSAAPSFRARLGAVLAVLCAASYTLPAQAQFSPVTPGGVVAAPTDLTRVYQGSDGSLFATRAIGSTVVGYSQDASGARAFVFSGTLSGSTLTGQYYGTPKGTHKGQGPMVMSVSNAGSTLTRTGGDFMGASSWLAVLPANVVMPQAREARFQSIESNDLTGAYKGSETSRGYLRQSGATVAFMAEKFANAGDARPAWATVFIGTRSSGGTGTNISGSYYDLPYQTGALNSGAFDATKVSGERTLAMTQWQGISGAFPLRSVTYTADYAVDLDRFAQEIRNRLDPYVVGYSYAIAQNGAVVKHGANGDRRTPTASNGLNAGWPFTSETLNEMASTTKTVTLVAVLRALRDRGISVDSPVSPYLPASWARGPGMNTVTFRQILSHGKKPVVGNGMYKPGDCSTDFYGCLRDAVAGGMVEPAGYDNIHYTIMRVILPFVLDPAGMAALFASANNDAYKNAIFSQQFRAYMQWILQQAGVSADFEYVTSGSETIAYRYAWGTPPSDETYNSTSSTDYLQAGSGGLKMKSTEFAKFLSKLEAGAILAPVDVATAKAIGFGGTGPVAGPAGVGPLWTKNGGAGHAASQLMVYPGTEAFITRNSTGNGAQVDDSIMLNQAWQAALVGP